MGKVVTKRPRLSIDITNGSIKRHIKIAAARQDMTIKDYCLEAITAQLMRDGELPSKEEERQRANALAERPDQLRAEIGPIGIRVCELIGAGHDGGWGPGIKRGYPPLELARREMCYRPRRSWRPRRFQE